MFDWLVVSNIFYVHPYLGKWSNLTNIFQMGWNHQSVDHFGAQPTLTSIGTNEQKTSCLMNLHASETDINAIIYRHLPLSTNLCVCGQIRCIYTQPMKNCCTCCRFTMVFSAWSLTKTSPKKIHGEMMGWSSRSGIILVIFSDEVRSRGVLKITSS